ncbi:MAG: cupredoxin domain-containing protein [Armatimonadetes bacterium]|nr:cupredoxin domain-containing protein [Armatimonadota bacterium]
MISTLVTRTFVPRPKTLKKMKLSNSRSNSGILCFAAFAVLTTSALGFGQKTKPAPVTQKVTVVVDNGFKPDSISVKAGKPVSITFDTKHKGCAAVVVFKELKLKKELKDGTKTTFTFTPTKAGTYSFGCGMGMYSGKVIVK